MIIDDKNGTAAFIVPRPYVQYNRQNGDFRQGRQEKICTCIPGIILLRRIDGDPGTGFVQTFRESR